MGILDREARASGLSAARCRWKNGCADKRVLRVMEGRNRRPTVSMLPDGDISLYLVSRVHLCSPSRCRYPSRGQVPTVFGPSVPSATARREEGVAASDFFAGGCRVGPVSKHFDACDRLRAACGTLRCHPFPGSQSSLARGPCGRPESRPSPTELWSFAAFRRRRRGRWSRSTSRPLKRLTPSGLAHGTSSLSHPDDRVLPCFALG